MKTFYVTNKHLQFFVEANEKTEAIATVTGFVDKLLFQSNLGNLDYIELIPKHFNNNIQLNMHDGWSEHVIDKKSLAATARFAACEVTAVRNLHRKSISS